MNGTTLHALMLCAGLAAPARAQVQELENGLRVRYVAVDGATDLSIALALPVGWRHDPPARTGCAELLRCTLELAQREVQPGTRFRVEARPSHTLVWHGGPARLFADRVDFLARLLAGRLEVSADLHALALGRARLLADDGSWLVPGRVNQQKAWRTLLHGRPAGRRNFGLPAELGAVDRAELQASLRRAYAPRGACLVVVGSLQPEAWEASVARLAAIPDRGAPPTPVVHDSAPPVAPSAIHDLVDGPFVTAALAAPGPADADFPAFVLAMTVVQARAMGEFTGRRLEWRAEFPPFAFEYWKDDPVVRINRRGRDAGPAAEPKQEIADLLAGLVRRGVDAERLDNARREVMRVFAAPPYAGLPSPVLAVRARYLATAACLGWPEDLPARIAAVPPAEVDRALRACLDPVRLAWFELIPKPETVERLTGAFRPARVGR